MNPIKKWLRKREIELTLKLMQRQLKDAELELATRETRNDSIYSDSVYATAYNFMVKVYKTAIMYLEAKREGTK